MENESRGLGATVPDSDPLGAFHAGQVVIESITLTCKTLHKWLFPALLLATTWVAGFGLLSQTQMDTEIAVHVSMIPAMLLTPFFVGAYLRILLAHRRGEQLNWSEPLSFGIRHTGRLFVTSFVLGTVFTIGYLAVIGIIAALVGLAGPLGIALAVPIGVVVLCGFVYYCCHWQLAAPVAVLGGQRNFEVLKASRELSRGRVGSILGAIIGASMLNTIIFYAVLFAMVLGGSGLCLLKPSTPVLYLAGAGAVLVLILFYLVVAMVPLTAQFLCFHYITRGEALIEELAK